jgi:hypothetical protein
MTGNTRFDSAMLFCKTNNLYFGEGNPDAKILFIGKEPEFSREEKETFKEELKTEKGLIQIAAQNAGCNLYRLQNNYQSIWLPKLRGDIKRSPTWLHYQRLTNKIVLPNEETQKLKWYFLDYCFITYLSQIRLPDSVFLTKNKLDNSIRIESIKAREKLFEYDFFKKPIVILACLHYPTLEFNKKKYGYYKFDIERIFDVKFIETQKVGNDWLNIHYNSDFEIVGKNRILIHTLQFSRFSNKNAAKSLISKLAEICQPFYALP